MANYTAVVLTETLVTFLATAAVCCFALALRGEFTVLKLLEEQNGQKHLTPFALALLGAFLTGLATLVRPEMPLLLVVAAPALVLRGWKLPGARKMLFAVAAMGAAFLIPLLPWAARNLVTLNKVQFIAPRYANLPGEYAPVGYYAWTATWLERYRDAYLSVWKIGEEPMELTDMTVPRRSIRPRKKRALRTCCASTMTAPTWIFRRRSTDKFAEIARERTAPASAAHVRAALPTAARR